MESGRKKPEPDNYIITLMAQSPASLFPLCRTLPTTDVGATEGVAISVTGKCRHEAYYLQASSNASSVAKLPPAGCMQRDWQWTHRAMQSVPPDPWYSNPHSPFEPATAPQSLQSVCCLACWSSLTGLGVSPFGCSLYSLPNRASASRRMALAMCFSTIASPMPS